ncbi:PP2C family protein-serine/threonine phosphatase [Magnetococcales bacterium HHB-1]
MEKIIANRIKAVGKTDVGCVRKLNEDAFAIDHQIDLLLVADGMGGHKSGEVASAKVVELIKEALNLFHQERLEDDEATLADPDMTLAMNLAEMDGEDLDGPTLDDIPSPYINRIKSIARKVNDTVFQMNEQRGNRPGSGMGSTVVGLWFPEPATRPVVFHVGDSRFYRFHRRKLYQVTRDHSIYQQWKDFGGTGSPPAQNIILQAIGPTQEVMPDATIQELEPGDIILLCSDGLNGMIPDRDISEILLRATPHNLPEICDTLIQTAKNNGGKDNVTAILGYVLQ